MKLKYYFFVPGHKYIIEFSFYKYLSMQLCLIPFLTSDIELLLIRGHEFPPLSALSSSNQKHHSGTLIWENAPPECFSSDQSYHICL